VSLWSVGSGVSEFGILYGYRANIIHPALDVHNWTLNGAAAHRWNDCRSLQLDVDLV
jgi:hypothetical protein